MAKKYGKIKKYEKKTGAHQVQHIIDHHENEVVQAKDELDHINAKLTKLHMHKEGVEGMIQSIETKGTLENLMRVTDSVRGAKPVPQPAHHAVVYEALEEQLKQLRFFSTETSLPFISLDFLDEKLAETDKSRARTESMKTAVQLASDMVIALDHAEPYFVSHDIVDLLTASLDSLPLTTALDGGHLPTPTGFVLLEKALLLPLTPHNMLMPLCAIVWQPARRTDGRAATAFHLMGTIGMPDGQGPDYARFPAIPRIQHFGSTQWDYGTSLGDLLDTSRNPRLHQYEYADQQRLELTARFICALLHFMGQRFVSTEHRRAPRAVNRRFEHERKVEEAPLIRVIQLRAREHKSSESDGTGSRWKVRSIRRAHWHNYWCGGGSDQCLSPGHKEARLETRFLLATICGPEGAPLNRATDVYAVVR